MERILFILKYLYRRPQHLLIRGLARWNAKSLDISKLNNVLIIAPHPDDEVLGCAGLIDQLVNDGKAVNILFMSRGEGISKNCKYTKEDIIDIRKQLTIGALSELGVTEERLSFLAFPDGKFSDVSNTEIEKLQSLILSGKYKSIFYPHHWDGSPDHNYASKVVSDILLHSEGIVAYEYCVWLWHHMKVYKAFGLDYKNAYLLNIDTEIKEKAISIYADAHDENGFYYSGKLPKMMLKAVTWSKELYFKANL